jgi:hypothetical protein
MKLRVVILAVWVSACADPATWVDDSPSTLRFVLRTIDGAAVPLQLPMPPGEQLWVIGGEMYLRDDGQVRDRILLRYEAKGYPYDGYQSVVERTGRLEGAGTDRRLLLSDGSSAAGWLAGDSMRLTRSIVAATHDQDVSFEGLVFLSRRSEDLVFLPGRAP